VTHSERLGDAISYLEAVAVGLRHSQPGELGIRLEEIARAIQSLAQGARHDEQSAGIKVPDALAPGYRVVCDDDVDDYY